ncbi:MAG: hypothetical protein Q4G65_09625 [bacterium]|nr:hypothetical protein [bacterium]
MIKRLLILTVLIMSICLSDAKPENRDAKPYTRLCYKTNGGTNVWFHSYLRCRMKNDEDYTFRRYRFVPRNGKVYYENGGILEVFHDKMVYMGVTNYFSSAQNFLITSTTNLPHGCIW